MKKNGDRVKKDYIERAGIFFSEFIGSLAGWLSLYVLLYRSQSVTPGSFDVFLGIVAVVGVSGFSYRIIDVLKGDN